MIWVAGEALIDLVPHGNTKLPIVGGGAANTAKALGKLGLKTSFIGGISSDSYGVAIREELSGVDLALSLSSDLPTALAIVNLDASGSATYEFKLTNTATFDFRRDWLPAGKPQVLHVGTLATIVEPGASALFEWARGLRVPIVYDPNIRPSVVSDREKYRSAVAKWGAIASVIKLSDEDLSWLGYRSGSELLGLGAELVIVTQGASGMSGFTSSGSISITGVRVEVADTVGAGDTVGAVIVEGISKFGLTGLISDELERVLMRAAKAAAITCTRRGAKPPSLAELGEL